MSETETETKKLPKQKVPKLPCRIGLKLLPPKHDSLNKSLSNSNDDIWSYNFNITNTKILNEQQMGKISNKNIINIIKKPFEQITSL